MLIPGRLNETYLSPSKISWLIKQEFNFEKMYIVYPFPNETPSQKRLLSLKRVFESHFCCLTDCLEYDYKQGCLILGRLNLIDELSLKQSFRQSLRRHQCDSNTRYRDSKRF